MWAGHPPGSSEEILARQLTRQVKYIVLGDPGNPLDLLDALCPESETLARTTLDTARQTAASPRIATVVRFSFSHGERTASGVFFALSPLSGSSTGSTLSQEILSDSSHCVFVVTVDLTKSEEIRTNSVQNYLRFAKSKLNNPTQGCRPAVVLCGIGVDQAGSADHDQWANKIFRKSSQQFPEFDHSLLQLVNLSNPSTLQLLRSRLLDAHEKTLAWTERSELLLRTAARIQLDHRIQRKKVVVGYDEVTTEVAQALNQPHDSDEVRTRTQHMLRTLHATGFWFCFDRDPVLCKHIFLDTHWVCSHLIAVVQASDALPPQPNLYKVQRWTDDVLRKRLGDVGVDQALFYNLLQYLSFGYLDGNDFMVLPQPTSHANSNLGKQKVVEKFLVERQRHAPSCGVLGRAVGLRNKRVDMLPGGVFQALQVLIARSDLAEHEFHSEAVIGRYRLPQCPHRYVFYGIYLLPSAHAIGVWVLEAHPSASRSGFLIRKAMEKVVDMVKTVFAEHCKGAALCDRALSERQLRQFNKEDFQCETLHGFAILDDPTARGDVKVSPTHPCPAPDIMESCAELLGDKYCCEFSLIVGCSPRGHEQNIQVELELARVQHARTKRFTKVVKDCTLEETLMLARVNQVTLLHLAMPGFRNFLAFTSLSGEMEPADADSLVGPLAAMAEAKTSHIILECVLLNCCLAGWLGKALHDAGLQNVIFWETAVRSDVCVKFAEAFHMSLEKSTIRQIRRHWKYHDAFFAGILTINEEKAVAFNSSLQQAHPNALSDVECEIVRRVQRRLNQAVNASFAEITATVIREITQTSVLMPEFGTEKAFDILWGAVLADHVLCSGFSCDSRRNSTINAVHTDTVRWFESATTLELPLASVKALPHCSAVFNMLFLAFWSRDNPRLDNLTSSSIQEARSIVEWLYEGIRVLQAGASQEDPSHIQEEPRVKTHRYVMWDPDCPTEVDGHHRKAVRDPTHEMFLVDESTSGALFQEHYMYLHPLIELRNSGDPPEGLEKGWYGWIGNTLILVGKIACGVPKII